MMRWMILLLIFMLCCLFGRRCSFVYRRRPKALREIMEAMALLEQRMQFYAEPLFRALLEVDPEGDSEICQGFQAMGHMLERHPAMRPESAAAKWLEGSKAFSVLTNEDRQLVQSIFFGATQHGGAKDRAFAYGKQRLEVAIQQAEIQRDRYAGLCQTIGLLIGGALVVLLA